MRTPIIKCSICLGNGKVQLSPTMMRTLVAIEKLGTPTIPEVFEYLKEDKHPTALNQRIKKLLELKLIECGTSTGSINRYQVV